ncbi:MAG TPA: M56 family metallopeptidase [Thermoanaerobaculia bacterium]
MNELQLLTGPIAQAIGWALLHLLWQATIVAGILAAVLSLMSRQTANARYVVSCGALALVFSMFVATAVRAYDPAAAPIAPAAGTTETIQITLTDIPVLVAQSAAASLRDRALSALSSARTLLPSIVGIWLAGVALLSARLLVSWIRARRLARYGAQPAAPELQLMAIRLSDALGLRGAVKLLQSAAVEVPSVIGSLRPVVLIPASALTGLTPEQIEMVLAHELAHIRRHDFLVNLLQAVVETLMFYHPAVWWMSRRVRIERENCCDDLAVAVCGNPIQYARALTRLEELRVSSMTVVVAANGGSLIERIRRIAAGRAEGTLSSSRWAAALAMLAVLVIAVAVPTLPALAERNEEKKKNEAKAEAASSQIDVVEVSPEAHLAVIDIADRHDDDDDYDYEPGVAAPEPPEPPEIELYRIAPRPATPAVPGVPAVAPAPHPFPAPSAHPAPPAPPAMLAMLDRNRADDEFEYEYEYEHVDEKTSERPIGEGGKLSVDELISLRAVGVTPEYVNTMRGVFPGLTLKGVTSMKAVGVTPEFVQQMRSAGFEVKTPKDATSLAAVGVTPEFVQQMRSAGFEVKTAKEATGLKAVGVDAEWMRGIRAAGIQINSAKDATSMKAVGVTPEFIREMRDAGFAVTSAKDASGLAAVGVTAAWVRGMKAAGVNITTAKEAQSMKAVGVTPEFVQRLAKAGYTNLTPRELSRMAAAGVDDDFIRDMEQYRKKN